MYKVIVDIAPKVVSGTNGCHKYVFSEYKTKKEAMETCNTINALRHKGVATIQKEF